MFCLNRENIIKIQIGFGMFQVNPLTVKNQNQFLSCKIVGKLIRLGQESFKNHTHLADTHPEVQSSFANLLTSETWSRTTFGINNV